MIERINEQPTPDESTLRLKGVYHDRRSGKDRRIGYTVIDPVSDRMKRDRRKFGYHSDSELKRNYFDPMRSLGISNRASLLLCPPSG